MDGLNLCRSCAVFSPLSGNKAWFTMESDGSVSPPHDDGLSALSYGSFQNSLTTLAPQAEEKPPISPRRAYIAVAVLCYVNLVNYIERYTIAGTWIFVYTWQQYLYNPTTTLFSVLTHTLPSSYRDPPQYSGLLCHKWWHGCTFTNRYGDQTRHVRLYSSHVFSMSLFWFAYSLFLLLCLMCTYSFHLQFLTLGSSFRLPRRPLQSEVHHDCGFDFVERDLILLLIRHWVGEVLDGTFVCVLKATVCIFL